MRLFFLLISFIIAAGIVQAQSTGIVLENKRELFVDNYLIDSLRNTSLKIGIPFSGGVALKLNESWEGRFAGAYVSVFKDGDIYRMYYRGKGSGNGANGEVTCYAESKDGINWIKPRVNIFTVNGVSENNVVMTGSRLQTSHNFTVMADKRAGVPAKYRYKAVGGVASSIRPARGLYRYVSEDGIHWQRFPDDTSALFKDGYGMDSQNVPVWLESENQYAIYLRTWTGDKPGDAKLLKGVRTIARSVSKDFINWSEPVTMKFGKTPEENLYTNATSAYFRSPHILIAMPFRFSPQSRVLSDVEMRANDIDTAMWQGVSDAVILSTRGGSEYQRTFMESFVRPGINQQNWAARSTIPALGIIPINKYEMSFFVTRAYGTENIFLERMVLRTDGFASLHAGYEPGYMITKPLTIKGKSLQLNYSTSSIGYVKVILLDEKGKELPGFGEKDAISICGDLIDTEIRWKSGRNISELGNRLVRVKMILRDADVYSIGVWDQ